MIEIDGIPPSSTMFENLAAEKRPVILNFSRGKDSICVWIMCERYGIEVIPIHKSAVPGLKFIEDDLKRYEDYFGQHIIDLPSDGFYRRLNNFVYQTPERLAVIEAANLPSPTREEWDLLMRMAFAEEDTWILDGVRATDSAQRRMAIKVHGAIKERTRRQSPIWDFGISDVRQTIEDRGITLGPDYDMFGQYLGGKPNPRFKKGLYGNGRSIDGIRYDYLKPIKDNYPEDYERILFWFPLAEMEILRYEEFA
ncbi:adenine nucleotide alpha hydrolase family protein [Rhodococcus rhodochrous]|uniref:hypothetical protein n=1 Tax=Rhodococcus rhodochrous TaxID=1829 RepID=UPI0017871B5A|nr:hypothetical protein [Rhodococcus rhodochrous]QOH59904.1 hypothetical protein C6Y44_27840 [Rhodococcus rhodochrous]